MNVKCGSMFNYLLFVIIRITLRQSSPFLLLDFYWPQRLAIFDSCYSISSTIADESQCGSYSSKMCNERYTLINVTPVHIFYAIMMKNLISYQNVSVRSLINDYMSQ